MLPGPGFPQPDITLSLLTRTRMLLRVLLQGQPARPAGPATRDPPAQMPKMARRAVPVMMASRV